VKPRDVLAIGGSAGGLEALTRLVADLPADLDASVLVTIHVGERTPSRLPNILARKGPLEAVHAQSGMPLERGRIHVAPPGAHLLLAGATIELSDGPRVNRHRPAVDVMFASAARWAGEQVVALVLSGLLDDGAVGAALVAQAGGVVVVQDPADAVFPSMPRAALRAAPGAFAAPAVELADLVSAMMGVNGLRSRPQERGPTVSDADMGHTADPRYLGEGETALTRLSCPECGGVIAEVRLPQITYYRCHVGHQYGPQTLVAAQADSAEAKLWAAVAALEENAAFARHLAEHVDADDREARTKHDATAERATVLADAVRSRLRADGPGLPQ
jgi:two-component system chemotaxis response regulator CheB